MNGQGWRTERCACGGAISAPADDWAAITEAVRAHNATPAHTSWRLGMRLERDPRSTGRDGLGVLRVAS